MKLYNTLTRKIETLHPLADNTVRIYSCGPTVYDHAHIGNLSAYIFADTLRRAVKVGGHETRHVMNYTDVDDKTIRRSHEQFPGDDPKAALKKLTDRYIALFNADMRQIGNDVGALHFLRATDYIEQIKQFIAQLHSAGFAYVADDGVYFSISAYRASGKTYGQLLELSASNTSEARIHNDEYDKDAIHDFALWKTQKTGEPAWDFTLDGHNLAGRPGWHIECSVMSQEGLGQPFDIHTGGVDLIFPHHENEIAQSTALETNPIMATIFAHNDHILVDGKKMSKSLGNFHTLQDIIDKQYSPLAFRIKVLQSHYRSQINFTWDALDAAQSRLESLNALAVLRWQAVDADLGDSAESYAAAATSDLHAPLLDDLNTPQALARISQRESEYADRLISVNALEGFEQYLQTIDDALGLDLMQQPDISAEQKQLIGQREEARAAKDWDSSDKLRDQLAQSGIGLRDTPHGAIWHRTSTIQ